MREVIMTVGLQASGKSTWSREWVLENPGKRKRINRDELRSMVDAGHWSAETEKFILQLRNKLFLQALNSGFDVVLDDTNLPSSNFTRICDLVRDSGVEATVRERVFPVELEVALARDAARTPSVGAEVIEKTWKRYMLAKGLRNPREQVITKDKLVLGAAIPPVAGALPAIICDLDGTLFKMGDRSPYDASRCDQVDSVNQAVHAAVRCAMNEGYEVIFMSGREEKDREPSARAIKKLANLPCYHLYMRATGDQRKDSEVKEELFNKHVRGRFNVAYVLDDRDQVVRKWREMGLTCFQVAPGAF